jgi:hypothetical protein
MTSAVAPLALSETPLLPQPAIEPGRCVLIEDVDWQTYEAIGEALRDRANIRLTYDRGRLEIMTLSAEHERLKILIGYLVQVLAEETNPPHLQLRVHHLQTGHSRTRARAGPVLLPSQSRESSRSPSN